MTPATLTALASALRAQQQADADGTSVAVNRQACDEAAAILEQVAGADAGCEVVVYQVSSIGEPDLGHWYNEDPLLDGFNCEGLVKQSDHLAALTAKSGEGVALYEALKGVVRVADRKTDEFDAARAAIAAYEAKRGGVR